MARQTNRPKRGKTTRVTVEMLGDLVILVDAKAKQLETELQIVVTRSEVVRRALRAFCR